MEAQNTGVTSAWFHMIVVNHGQTLLGLSPLPQTNNVKYCSTNYKCHSALNATEENKLHSLQAGNTLCTNELSSSIDRCQL